MVNLTIRPCLRVDVTKAGVWIEKDTGFLHNAGAPGSSGLMLNKSYDVTEIPVFIKAGTVLPSTPVRAGDTVGLAMRQYVELQFSIYPGTDSGEGAAYEDDAGTDAYLNGAFAETALTYTRSDTAFEATITTTGNYTELPKARQYTLMVSATMHMHMHVRTNKRCCTTTTHTRHCDYTFHRHFVVHASTLLRVLRRAGTILPLLALNTAA